MENEIIKLLEMCKSGKLTVEATADLLEAMYNGDGEEYTDKKQPSGPKELPWEDNGRLYIAAFVGHKYLKAEELPHTGKKIEISYNGEALDVECQCGDLTCGDVHGNAKCGGGLVSGNIGGNASCGGGCTVNGSVGQNLSCGGGCQVTGSAGGNVSCGGSMTVGGNVENGGASAGGNANIGGDVNGDVKANGSVTCKNISGKADSKNGRVNGVKTETSADSNDRDIRIEGVNVSEIVRNATDAARNAVSAAMGAVASVKIGTPGKNDESVIVIGNREGKPKAETGTAIISTGTVSDSLPDDDVIRIALFKGRSLISSADRDDGFTADLGDFEPTSVYCTGSIECGDVSGNLTAGGSVKCDTVEGNVNAGDSITCDEVEGNATAGDSIQCDGVEGNVSAGDSVSCEDVGGDVSCGDSVDCGNVEGSVKAGDSVECGNVEGDVIAEGDVNCGNIGGNVTVNSGDISCGDISGGIHNNGGGEISHN